MDDIDFAGGKIYYHEENQSLVVDYRDWGVFMEMGPKLQMVNMPFMKHEGYIMPIKDSPKRKPGVEGIDIKGQTQ